MGMFELTPKETKDAIITCFEAGVVPFITSSPGIGKSAIARQICDEYSLVPIDLRLSQCAPEDLMGLPMRENGKAVFTPFKIFPLKGEPLPEGKNGWLLFLDEFNSAPKSVQASAYKVVLDRMVGQEDLHENVFVMAAGNKATDRAIVNDLSTAMQSRLVHLEMVADHREFINHATKNGFDHRVMGFLEFQPGKLHQFQPDHNDKTFACPRTWEFASKLIKGKSFEQISLPLLAGTISEGVAVEFHTFLRLFETLPSYNSIIASPEKVDIPTDSGTKYAVITLLIERLAQADLDKAIQYIKRMPPEFQVIYFRSIVQKDPSIKRAKAFVSNISHLTRFLNDDDDINTAPVAA